MKPRDKEDLVSMLMAGEVDAAADYVKRGRAHRDLSDADLARAWVNAFRAGSHYPDPSSPVRLALKDLTAEMDLRNIKPPFDAVLEDLDRIRARVGQFIADHPGRLEEIERSLQADLKAHRDQPKN